MHLAVLHSAPLWIYFALKACLNDPSAKESGKIITSISSVSHVFVFALKSCRVAFFAPVFNGYFERLLWSAMVKTDLGFDIRAKKTRKWIRQGFQCCNSLYFGTLPFRHSSTLSRIFFRDVFLKEYFMVTQRKTRFSG